jgi:alpha-beta hydrolase superfamily lysophospholipase
VSAPDVLDKLYEGHYHDLLNDIGKKEVMADILRWINARLRP